MAELRLRGDRSRNDTPQDEEYFARDWGLMPWKPEAALYHKAFITVPGVKFN
jgi:hypothetical protein